MKAFRSFFQYWNESGVLVSLLLIAGHFGAKGALGWLPVAIVVLYAIGSFILSVMIAKAQEPQDEYGSTFQSESETDWNLLERILFYSVLFALGSVMFVGLGTVI
jgi:hypothetical protein